MSVDQSPFDDYLLRTGFVPDESQSRQIIASQREAIEAIDSQISDLEQRIVDLRNKRQDVWEKMASNEGFLAPIRQIAPEILCKIFEYCLPPETTKNPTAPLLLLGVCHTWRRIVEVTPQLWGKIHIGSRTRMPLVEAFLRNSMAVSLDGAVQMGDYTFETSSETDEPPTDEDDGWGPGSVAQTGVAPETTKIIRVISEQYRRIRRLSLHGPCSIISLFFPSRFRIKTSLLEEFTMKSVSWSPLNLESCFRLKGGRLRTLTLDADAFFITSINRTFGLRRLSLHGIISVSKLLQFLRGSTALEELIMEKFWPREPRVPEPELEPVFMTKLSLLEISLDDRSWHTQGLVQQSLLRNIRATAVTSVSLRSYRLQLDDMYTFLTWSAKSIFRLSLVELGCNPYQFFRMLSWLSALEVLFLADPQISQMWEALIPEVDADPNGWICPKLTTLELRTVDVDSNFVEFVRRRTRPVQSETNQDGFQYIKTVAIKNEFIPPEICTSLRNLQSQRVDFSVVMDESEVEA